jgi:hypothetical protein
MPNNPLTGKPVHGLGHAIIQNYLGRNGVQTHTSVANQAAYDAWKARKERERKERERESRWWSGDTKKK